MSSRPLYEQCLKTQADLNVGARKAEVKAAVLPPPGELLSADKASMEEAKSRGSEEEKPSFGHALLLLDQDASAAPVTSLLCGPVSSPVL